MMKFTAIKPLFAFGLLFFTPASFADSLPECYQFETLDSPERIDLSQLNHQFMRHEKWCYQKKMFGNRSAMLIFNGDANEVKKEMSALVWLDKNGKPQQMSAGSLHHGKKRIIQVPDLKLNPFAAPLDVEVARLQGKPTFTVATLKSAQVESLGAEHWLNVDPATDVTVKEGTFDVSVPDANKPFNGFWWSDAGVPMATGPSSPLGAYDGFVKARTGQDPKSVVWENAYHSDQTNIWGGHCNGWTASTVLYPEPRDTLYDPMTKTMITPYAQKGLIAEASFCANVAFYGHRYGGGHGEDIRDIYPDQFHKLLLYYIQGQGKTISMDYDRTAAVDNNIITGFHTEIKKTKTTRSGKTFHLNTTLTVAQYDAEQGDSLGLASTYEKKYSYTLNTDLNGNILNGKWDQTSDNPDFMWVPLSIAARCGSRNSQIDVDQVNQLLTTLPKARQMHQAINLPIHQDLYPQDQVQIPFTAEAGDHFKLRLNVQGLNPNPKIATLLIVSGKARYPVTGGEMESMFIPLNAGEQVVAIDRLLSIESFALVNQSETVTTRADLMVEGIDYLAP